MKYKNGNIVVLKDGRTVYVVFSEEKSKTYYVYDIDDNDCNSFPVEESDIYSLVVS